MTQHFSTIKLATTAMLVAIAVILTQAIRILGLGHLSAILSPMHLPIMLIGMLCGWRLALIGAMLVPMLCFALSGGSMPPFPIPLVPMLAELSTYGVTMGILCPRIITKNKHPIAKLLLWLTIAMLVGRLLYSTAKAILLAILGTSDLLTVLWVSLVESITNSWVSIPIVLTTTPIILLALRKNHILDKYISD